MKDYLMAVKSTTSPTKFSNGRFVRNVIEKSIRVAGHETVDGRPILKNDLITIKSQDLAIKEEASAICIDSKFLRGLFFARISDFQSNDFWHTAPFVCYDSTT